MSLLALSVAQLPPSTGSKSLLSASSFLSSGFIVGLWIPWISMACCTFQAGRLPTSPMRSGHAAGKDSRRSPITVLSAEQVANPFAMMI